MRTKAKYDKAIQQVIDVLDDAASRVSAMQLETTPHDEEFQEAVNVIEDAMTMLNSLISERAIIFKMT